MRRTVFHITTAQPAGSIAQIWAIPADIKPAFNQLITRPVLCRNGHDPFPYLFKAFSCFLSAHFSEQTAQTEVRGMNITGHAMVSSTTLQPGTVRVIA